MRENTLKMLCDMIIFMLIGFKTRFVPLDDICLCNDFLDVFAKEIVSQFLTC